MVGTAMRLGAALAVYLSGLIHLQLYLDGYKDFPDENLGRAFLLNAVVSVAVATVLLVRRDVVVRLAAAAVLVGTLFSFALSRTDHGIFGFSESGLSPSPQAGLALLLELAGIVLLAATFLRPIGSGEPLAPPTAGVVAAVAIVVAVAAGIAWGRGSSAAPAGSIDRGGAVITISDFTFHEATLEVPVGTTVEWINGDSPTHSVAAEDGSFRSDDLATGDRFTFTFDAPGTYAYLCGIHPSMRGDIIVTG